ncbi:hypothetical protein BDD12DRAFT_825010 [Trichophaea hybrida]|nr:hypothetical protein BDD12DRAFT_825010 [Trichophaea hybrida]
MTSSTLELTSESGFSLEVEVEHLSDDNYFDWSTTIEHVLRFEKLWDIVSGDESQPPPTAAPDEIRSFRRRKNRAMAFIGLTAPSSGLVSCGVYSRASNHTDPKELWDTIRESYRRIQSLWNIRRRLYHLRLENCEDVLDYTGKINHEVMKYNFAKGDTEEGRMANDEHTFFYINGLPESWKEAEVMFRLNRSLINNPEELEKEMRTYEESTRWLREARMRDVTCWKCGENGHYRNQCPN